MPTVTGDNFYIDKHTLQFRTGTTSTASIEYSKVDDSISINTAGTGSINIGDAGGDIFIGDGSTQSDLVFEQNGAIRALANKTLTLGQSDSNVVIAAQNFTISGDSDISGEVNFQKVDVTGATSWAGRDNQHGAIYLSSEDRGLLGNMGGGYARPLIQGGSNAVTIGSNGTSAIRDVTVYAGNGAGAAMSNFNVFTSGSKRMTITRSGTMGFGGGLADNPYQAVVFDLQDSRMDILNGAVKIRYAANNDAITLTPSVGNEARILASDGDTSSPHPLKIAADRIRFTTSGVSASNEVMRITADGKVGIGTDDPAKLLDIDGDTRVKTAEFQITSSAAFTTHLNYQDGGNNYISQANGGATFFRNNGGTLMALNSDGDLLIGGPTDTHDRLMTLGAANVYAARFNGSTNGGQSYGVRVRAGTNSVDIGLLVENTAGDDLFKVRGDGKIGVGTGTPQEMLHVYATGHSRVEAESTAGFAALKATNNQGSFGWYVHNTMDSFRLFDFGASTDYITVSGNGNVAIGTDLAPQKLNVKGTIVHLNSSNIQVAGITNSSNAGRLYANNAGGVTKVLLDSNGDSYFNGGDVGIGTNAPALPLHVEGSVLIDAYNQTSGSGQGIFFRQGFTAGNKYNLSILTHNDGDTSPDALDINAYDGINFCVGSNTRNPKVSIKSDGDVGIGTVSPAKQVEIRAAEPYLRLEESDSGGNKRLDLFVSQSTGVIAANQSAQTMMFQTVGVNRMTIASDGDVGIGTTDPTTARLRIKGTTNDSSALTLQCIDSTEAQTFFVRNDGVVQVTDNYFYVSASAGAYVQTDLRVRGSLSNDGGPLAIGGAVNFTTTTGMVGIGTNSPRSGRLHIYNSNSVSDGDGSASMNPTGQDSIVLYTQGGANKNFGSISWLDGGRRRAMIAAASERADGDYQGLSFFTRGTDGPGDLYESMRINHGGTVGIGVTGAAGFHANAERLVVGDGAGSEGITIYAGSSNAASLYFADGTAGDAAYRGFVQYSHSAEKLFLGAGGGTQMTLTNTSLVGIGTQSPTYELDVAGTIRTTGGNVLVQKQDPQVIFTDQGGSTYDASWMYQNNAIKFVWGGGHKFKVDNGGGTTLGQSFSSNYSAPSKGIIMEGRLGVGTSGVGEASLYVADLTSETNGKAIISGTGTCTLASDLYVYGSGNGDVINAVRDRNDASIKVTSTTAGAYFRTNSATATYNGIDLNTNWFIGQYGYNDLRIVDGTASAGDAAAAVTIENTTKNVGIGTTNPSEKLHVYGGDVRISDSTPVLTFHDTSSSALTTLTLDGVNTTLNNNGTNGSLIFSTENSEAMRIDQDGNVGIGSNAPTKHLEVQTNSEHEITTGLLIHNNVSTTGTAGKGVGITMGRAGGTYSSKIANVWTNNNPSYLQTNIAFYTMHDSHAPGTETEKMRLTSRGRLGIGTDAPDNQLHVETDVNEVAKFQSTDPKGYIRIRDNNYSSYIGINSTAGAASFGGQVDGAADTGNLNISTINGKVGIGTTSFSQQLGVKPDTDVAAEIGKAHVGYLGHADYAGFCHVDMDSANSYALLQSSDGHTYLNAAASKAIHFRQNNGDVGGFNISDDFFVDVDTLYVDASEDSVGINTSSPGEALDIVGYLQMANTRSNSTQKIARMLVPEYNNSHGSFLAFMGTANSSSNFVSYGGGTSSADAATVLAFYTASAVNTTVGTERMRITNAGRVGIGTDSPGYELEVNGSIVGSSKSFLIDHPTQTGKKLMHACIEGPENGVYFRGKSQETSIQAPEYWSGLVDIDSMTVDVTPIGPNQSIYVDRIDDNGDIYVGSNTDEPLNYFYVVYGERKDIDKLEIVKDTPPPTSEQNIVP